jgi:hypothetical protein
LFPPPPPFPPSVPVSRTEYSLGAAVLGLLWRRSWLGDFSFQVIFRFLSSSLIFMRFSGRWLFRGSSFDLARPIHNTWVFPRFPRILIGNYRVRPIWSGSYTNCWTILNSRVQQERAIEVARLRLNTCWYRSDFLIRPVTGRRIER